MTETVPTLFSPHLDQGRSDKAWSIALKIDELVDKKIEILQDIQEKTLKMIFLLWGVEPGDIVEGHFGGKVQVGVVSKDQDWCQTLSLKADGTLACMLRLKVQPRMKSGEFSANKYFYIDSIRDFKILPKEAAQ